MRGDVALSGNFGFELDLAALDPAQLEEAKARHRYRPDWMREL
jgi:hypothetical protein